MWDTGIEDAVADEPGDKVIAHNIRGIVARKIRCQLGDVGITPEVVKTMILSRPTRSGLIANTCHANL